ncbi:MAG: biotin/lipoyl-binding protein, partial [Acidobacteriaceae bacterium]|nr:biotin/lipoyl-binding protein [Acidobacteriaceae bacterium]
MIRYDIYLVLVCVLALAGCSAKGGGNAAEDAQPVTPVEVATARLGSIHRSTTSEAVLYPLRQATIVPKVTAPVQKFYAQRGDHVREGQLLAVLESRDLQA